MTKPIHARTNGHVVKSERGAEEKRGRHQQRRIRLQAVMDNDRRESMTSGRGEQETMSGKKIWSGDLLRESGMNGLKPNYS